MKTSEFLQGEIRGYIEKAGKRRAIVGLSGGLDSAVVCKLCINALGADNVKPISIAVAGNQLELRDAHKAAEHLDIPLLTAKNYLVFGSYHDAVRDIRDEAAPDNVWQLGLRSGNICARLRTVVLYDASVMFDGLVIGCANRTEILMGFGTVYGDLAAAMHPLGSLYKTEVRELAAELGFPKKMVEMRSTAHIWGDEAIPASEKQLDIILKAYIDEIGDLDEAEIAEQLGIEPELLRKVARRVERSMWKWSLPYVPIVHINTVMDRLGKIREIPTHEKKEKSK